MTPLSSEPGIERVIERFAHEVESEYDQKYYEPGKKLIHQAWRITVREAPIM